MNLLTLFKRKYKTNYEYWVNLCEIKINPQFTKSPPRSTKMAQKYNWYCKYGEFQSPIVLDHNFVLIDGYTSYLIAKEFDLEKVPVYFE